MNRFIPFGETAAVPPIISSSEMPPAGPTKVPPVGQAPLPTEVHTDRCISTECRASRPIRDPQEPADLPTDTAVSDRRKATLRAALLCAALVIGAAAVLVPAVRTALESSGSLSGSGFGEALGGALLQGGLPPTDRDPAVTEDSDTDETTAYDTGGQTAPETPGASEPGSDPDTDSNTAPSENDPFDTVSDTTVGGPLPSPVESTSESTVLTTPEVGTAPYESVPDTAESGPADSTPESEALGTDSTETEEQTETEPADPPTTEPPSETMPDGCFPIVREDKSDPERSVGYIVNTAGNLPPSIPGEGTRLWSTAEAPMVLIVHTHPYEGYGDGGDWYDPATGGLAQTESVNAPDGVVALGVQLARDLRERGVTVIHLRVPVSEGESASSTYDRTEAMVRYYCQLYPEIGLVLDLRRSAEMTDGGGILRTDGELDGLMCAQVRMSVSGGRSQDAVARDIALAVSMRRALWEIEPSVSRPVWVKNGAGMAAELDGVAVLTLELGAAGNTYTEAERLLTPLAEVIAAEVLRE